MRYAVATVPTSPTSTMMKWTSVHDASNWMLTRHSSMKTRLTNAGESQSNDRPKVWEFPLRRWVCVMSWVPGIEL